MKYDFDQSGGTFAYFILTLLSLFIIPTTIAYLSSSQPKLNESQFCLCEGCQKKKALLQKSLRKNNNWTKFLLYCLALVLFAYFTFVAVTAVVEHVEYDPYKILEIERGASVQEIKKQYRSLMLKWHPDKVKEEDKEMAESMFVDITKAYQSLTDDEIRKNWEEYGNPDGQRTFALGIALPAWMVSSGNSYKVLGVYGLIVGIMMPWFVNKWWVQSKKFSKNKILNSTMAMYYKDLKDQMNVQKLLIVLSSSHEFKELDSNSQLVSILAKDLNGLDITIPPKLDPHALKAIVLLQAHLHRKSIDPLLLSDQQAIVQQSVRLLAGMMQICLAKGWLSSLLHCMTLTQLIIQAIPEPASALMCLPFVTDLKHFQKVTRIQILYQKKNIHNLSNFMALKTDAQRSLCRTLDDDQFYSMMTVARSIPIVSVVSVDFSVLDEPHVLAGGLVTCSVGLVVGDKVNQDIPDVENPVEALATGDEDVIMEGGSKKQVTVNPNPPIHAPFYPLEKRPGWYVILMEPNSMTPLAQPLHVIDLVTTKKVKLQFPAPNRPGTFMFMLHVISDCFCGLDIKQQVKMVVVEAKFATRIDDDGEISDDGVGMK